MKLFFVLVCCLAIPLVTRAADRDNQNNNKKEKQTTQGQQPQAVSQGKHNGANTASQLNNPSQLKSQGQHQRLNAQNKNVPAVQSSTKGKVEAKHHDANTASRNPSHLKGQHKGLNAQNNNVPAVQSNTKGKVEAKHFSLSNSPNPKIASTKFQQNYRIQGSQNWQGQNYAAFQNYRGEWHDQGWWNNRYDRIVLTSVAGIFGMPAIGIRRGVTIRPSPTTHIMALSTPTTICRPIR
jgi:hypothetical protein